MALTPDQLNRATLERQLLLRRTELPVTNALDRCVALQAQEAASPYIAMWTRIESFDPGELDAAFDGRDIVKATLMRITLHAIRESDYHSFHEAMRMTLRDSRLNDRRFRATGLSPADIDVLIEKSLVFATDPRSNSDFQEFLAGEVEEPHDGIWWALRQVAPLHHSPGSPPWSFGSRPSYLAASVRESLDHLEAVGQLFLRYLAGFGPATLQDFNQFSMIRQSEIKPAVAALGDRVGTLEGPDGITLYDYPDGTIPNGDEPAAPRLLPMWDSILFAYKDRTRVIPEPFRRALIRRNGDTLPAVLVDGRVAGVWRPADGGIEVTAFQDLDASTWDGLADEAQSLLELLAERDPNVYSRYRRWWDDLPAATVRTLG